MQIRRIYVVTHRNDLYLARICIASIRRWYPRLPICLIKDAGSGPFSTRELQRHFGVELLHEDARSYGWGFGKLEPLFQEDPAAFLVLDPDIVLIGPLLQRLEAEDADVVVEEAAELAPDFDEIYYDRAKLAAYDPTFVCPGFGFNAGQFVARGGLFKRSDFAELVDFDAPVRQARRPDIFKSGDQGLFNYLVMRKAAAGELRVARVPFMKWGESGTREVRVDQLTDASPYRALIHWAGMKRPLIRDMMRSDILQHFEASYYRRVPLGRFKRFGRTALEQLRQAAKRRKAAWANRGNAVSRGLGEKGSSPLA